MTRRNRAFTLVELLVVIGIIALLISMLLPALNKARQNANLIDCQARLRQMGQAMQIYTVSNKGLLPWGVIVKTAPFITPAWTSSTADAEQWWWWHFTLSQIINPKLVGTDGAVHNLSPIFRDKDTIENPVEPRYVNHYTVNERVLWNNNDFDAAGPRFGNEITQRKISSIKPSGVFVIWDGPQGLDYLYNTYELATGLDGSRLTFGHYFVRNTAGVAGTEYSRPVTPGAGAGMQTANASACKLLQKKWNIDIPVVFDQTVGWKHLRYRHMNNTSLNALCLDGHVEARKVGEATVSDFCTNYPY